MIQGAQSGSISQVNATTSTLELSGVSDKTILFSDRPDRIVGSANTTDFIGNWSIGENNFAVDPPNAVLILDDEVEQRQDSSIIELFNPQYDPEANTLKYDIKAENASSIDLPGEFGQSTIIIDDDNRGHSGGGGGGGSFVVVELLIIPASENSLFYLIISVRKDRNYAEYDTCLIHKICIIITMSKKLVGETTIGDPYIVNDTNKSEIIFSIHIPFEIHARFVKST